MNMGTIMKNKCGIASVAVTKVLAFQIHIILYAFFGID